MKVAGRDLYMSFSGIFIKRFLEAALALLLVMLLFDCLGQQAVVGRPQLVLEANRGNRLNQIAEWPVEGVPSCIAAGSESEVYVAINRLHKVVRYNIGGEKVAEFGLDGNIAPNGMVMGPRNGVYISGADMLARYSSYGERQAEWSLDGLPNGVAVGPGEEVLVLFDHRLVAYGPQGQRRRELNVEAGAEAIASAPDGSIYLAYPQRVVRYSPGGEKQGEWMVEGANSIDGIVVDGRGRVYVTINNSHRVVSFSAAGEMLSGWDLEGNFSGLAVSPEGLIFAADVDDSTIRVFQTGA
jgi:hypothetical protein